MEAALYDPRPFTVEGRSANERAILSLLRREGPTASAEIARQTGLSAQSASVITRNLESDGLVVRDTPVRGKVGKPSTPLRLDPNGAFSIGLRLGRRRSDLVLLDLAGTVRGHMEVRYAYPTPDGTLHFLKEGTRLLMEGLTPDRRSRVAGIGVGMPFDLWDWLDNLGAPESEMAAWRNFDAMGEIAAVTGLPTFVGNDGSLSCLGEHMFGNAVGFSDFAHAYVGAFVGGGIVIGNRLYHGLRGNAGAIATIPVTRPDGTTGQLLEVASLYELERLLDSQEPGSGQRLLQSRHWDGFDEVREAWMAETARRLAQLAVVLAAVLDLPVIVIDGSFPAAIRASLVDRTARAMEELDTRGIHVPRIVAGKLGTMACALGAGYRPIVARYLQE
ncbi:ROK family transcriptional regulator [Pelagovum pacificum]|uniref:ROK family transcriptional regulator n=1 Tax=Pelagovum pacificum TaxID=2588711 RepID=A0A5C5GGW7_9RHOB|nr:ROK family transcriptional regulator [Pelagovum pacificum]QQA42872.1 ROK family transcriptional regulator [Pelagovum pacificum]TNY33982.1 ROK family transcriptional regulator [Pelagovum pacificum]